MTRTVRLLHAIHKGSRRGRRGESPAPFQHGMPDPPRAARLAIMLTRFEFTPDVASGRVPNYGHSVSDVLDELPPEHHLIVDFAEDTSPCAGRSRLAHRTM